MFGASYFAGEIFAGIMALLGGGTDHAPTTTPVAGYVSVGETGRLDRNTGRITPTASGRVRR
jgi:hypothetical protein